jgi:hypothetical protein
MSARIGSNSNYMLINLLVGNVYQSNGLITVAADNNQEFYLSQLNANKARNLVGNYCFFIFFRRLE